MADSKIKALTPEGEGHQFVFYGDSCSGIAEALHAQKLARVNAVVQRLDPAPEWVVFPGDEIIGLVPGEAELRQQWAYFFDVEMAWLSQSGIPHYHTTGNHTVYDKMSERVFAAVMAHLPRNGPEGQDGLSYVIRRGDVVMVFVNTLWSGLGGEGHLELDWLAGTLKTHADARWKFVVGHHPAFTVNGYGGPYQRNIGPEYAGKFWQILTGNGVTAYLCSHILAFDVQCHKGVLQITSAGAGTAHRMPDGVEYLHCVQMAVDQNGLRYQVLDEDGQLREHLCWPPDEPEALSPLKQGMQSCPWGGRTGSDLVTQVRLQGRIEGSSARQTLLAAVEDDGSRPLWIGLTGRQRQLTLVLQPERGRSPHQWLGPCLHDDEAFDLDILLHGGMGPGGLLWRPSGPGAWTGFHGLSPHGLERVIWPKHLCVGQCGAADSDTRFEGVLAVSFGLV